jgi:hypothetical protein
MDLRELLKPGITGDLVWRHGPVADPVTEVDRKRWLTASHERVRLLGGRVGTLQASPVGRSYRALQVELPHQFGGGFLVLHSVLPLVAALRYAEFRHDEEYLDCPLEQDDLGDRFAILPKSLLDARFVFEPWMRDVLSPQGFWYKPRRIGDLVFNHFD